MADFYGKISFDNVPDVIVDMCRNFDISDPTLLFNSYQAFCNKNQGLENPDESFRKMYEDVFKNALDTVQPVSSPENLYAVLEGRGSEVSPEDKETLVKDLLGERGYETLSLNAGLSQDAWLDTLCTSFQAYTFEELSDPEKARSLLDASDKGTLAALDQLGVTNAVIDLSLKEKDFDLFKGLINYSEGELINRNRPALGYKTMEHEAVSDAVLISFYDTLLKERHLDDSFCVVDPKTQAPEHNTGTLIKEALLSVDSSARLSEIDKEIAAENMAEGLVKKNLPFTPPEFAVGRDSLSDSLNTENITKAIYGINDTFKYFPVKSEETKNGNLWAVSEKSLNLLKFLHSPKISHFVSEEEYREVFAGMMTGNSDKALQTVSSVYQNNKSGMDAVINETIISSLMWTSSLSEKPLGQYISDSLQNLGLTVKDVTYAGDRKGGQHLNIEIEGFVGNETFSLDADTSLSLADKILEQERQVLIDRACGLNGTPVMDTPDGFCITTGIYPTCQKGGSFVLDLMRMEENEVPLSDYGLTVNERGRLSDIITSREYGNVSVEKENEKTLDSLLEEAARESQKDAAASVRESEEEVL